MVAEVHLDRYLQSWEEKLAKFSKRRGTLGAFA